jgi:Na+/citrate or Na+/malate symporter
VIIVGSIFGMDRQVLIKGFLAVDPGGIAAAGVTAIALYLLGTACFKLFGLPGPVAMLFLAVLVKLTRAVPPSLQLAGQTVYKFFSTAVTYPLLFASCCAWVSALLWDY